MSHFPSPSLSQRWVSQSLVKTKRKVTKGGWVQEKPGYKVGRHNFTRLCRYFQTVLCFCFTNVTNQMSDNILVAISVECGMTVGGELAPVVQKLDGTIHRINRYPVDK